MNQEVVSIIVPVYNAENYIEQNLDSLINQTYRNIDIVLVDDGSTDSSNEKCKLVSDSRIRLFHQANSGLSATRQFGIEQAIGDYICTIDADDYLEDTFVEKMVGRIIQTNSDICVCGRIDLLPNGYRKEVRLQCSKETHQVTAKELETSYYQLVKQYVMSDSWNKLYRKEFLLQSKVKFELPKQYNGNDLAFNHKLIMHNPQICVVDEQLIIHRIVDGSMAHKRKKLLQEGFEVIISQLFQEAEKCNLQISDQLGMCYYSFLLQVVMNIIKYGKGLNSEISEYLRQHENYLMQNKNLHISIKGTEFPSLLQKTIIKKTVHNDKMGLLILAYFCTCVFRLKNYWKR